MSILAETEEIKELLLKNGIEVETVADIHPIHVQPSRVLSHIYARLGKNSDSDDIVLCFCWLHVSVKRMDHCQTLVRRNFTVKAQHLRLVSYS